MSYKSPRDKLRAAFRTPTTCVEDSGGGPGDANATSDLPLKADIKRTSREVRSVPISDIAGLA